VAEEKEISYMQQVTDRLKTINEEGAEDRNATKGKGIQSSLLRDQIKILEVIANSVAMLNNNFEEFMQNQALASLKGLDPEDKGGVQGKTSGAKNSGDKDDAGFLFDGIVASFIAFKASMMLFGTRLLNFIKRIALPVTAVIALIKGFMEDFESTEGTFGEKVVAGLGGAIQKLFKWLIAVPSQFVVDLAAWLARKFGANEAAAYLEKVDVAKMWEDLLKGIGEFLKPMTDMIANGIDWFMGPESEEAKEMVSTVIDTVFEKIKSIAKGLADLFHFFTTGEDIGIVTEIQEMYQGIVDWLSTLPDKMMAPIIKIQEMYQGIVDWFSELPSKLFNGLGDLTKKGLSALGFGSDSSEESAGDDDYDPKTVIDYGDPTRSGRVTAAEARRAELTGELTEAEKNAFKGHSQTANVNIAPQSNNTNVNNSTTNVTASSGPVRDPNPLKNRSRETF